MSEQLFVYGTLHPERAPLEIQGVVKQLTPVGKASIFGNLQDLGEYPGLTFSGKKRRIEGNVFELPNDPSALKALDKYEEFLPENPAGSLFIRMKKTVKLADGRQRRCWVYVYNETLPVAS